MCLEDGYKVERQPVPGREFPPTRGTGTVYDDRLRRPLGATSGGEKTDNNQNTRTMAAFTGHRILFVDVLMNFVQRDVEASNGSAFGGRSYEEDIYAVSTSKYVHAPVVRTSMMYGRVGRIYGTYSKLGCSLRNCIQRPSQNQLTVTGNGDPGVDRPAPNGPSLSQSQLSAEVSFSVPFHQGTRIGERVRGRECVTHRRQVVVEAGDTVKVSIRDNWQFSSVE